MRKRNESGGIVPQEPPFADDTFSPSETTKWSFTLNYPDDKPKIVEGFLTYGPGTYDVKDEYGGRLLFSIPYMSVKFVEPAETGHER